MRRGALEWLRALRERAERRAAGELRERQVRLAGARRLRVAEPMARPGEGAGAGELALASRRATWAAEEQGRLARRVAEALASVLESRAAAETARALEAGRREAALRERSRRAEEAAGEEHLARAQRAVGRGHALPVAGELGRGEERSRDAR